MPLARASRSICRTPMSRASCSCSAGSSQEKLPDSNSTLHAPMVAQAPQNGANGRSPVAGGALGDALRNLQRYVQRDAFDNTQGGGGQFGPELQFDTKGVEFGPWV